MLVKLLTIVALGCLVSVKSERVLQSNVFYVKPNKDTTCKETPCHTLLWYTSHGGNTYFKSHSRMIFLPGEHGFHNTTASIADVTNFSMVGCGTVMTGMDGMTHSECRITCGNTEGGFTFINSSNIQLSQLTFENCGANTSNDQSFDYGDTRLLSQNAIFAAVAFITSKNIRLFKVVFRNNFGHGLLVNGCSESFDIDSSVFTGSRPHKNGKATSNAHFWYRDCSNIDQISLNINDSWFTNGSANRHITEDKQYGAGLSLQLFCPNTSVSIENVTLQNNSQTHGNGANIDINIMDTQIRVIINNSRLVNGQAKRGGGLSLLFSKLERNSTQSTVEIQNTVFDENKATVDGGAVHIQYYEFIDSEVDTAVREVTFSHCNFTRNQIGGAVTIINHKLFPNQINVAPQLAVTFVECLFSGNERRSISTGQRNNYGILNIYSMQKITVKESTFVRNTGTAILLTSSSLTFEGQTLFKDNNGDQGGALKLSDDSLLLFVRESHVMFIRNNVTQLGGAIYIEQPNISPPCFFQPQVNISSVKQLGKLMRLQFINNSAGIAGHAIYGGSVDDCFTLQQFSGGHKRAGYFQSTAIFNTIFSFSMPHPSLITSDPQGVCTCSPITSYVNCSQTVLPIDTFAGKTFTVSVSAVGQRNGSVPSLITVNNNPNVRQGTKTLTNELCQDIELTVYSEANLAIVILLAQSTRSFDLSTQTFTINASLQPCPWVFELNKNSAGKYECMCNHILTRFGLNCDINTESIRRGKKGIWMGCLDKHFTNSNQTGSLSQCKTVAVNNDCIEEYCSNYTGFLNVSTIPNQCAHGRTGIMCGSCADGYSLALGPLSKCVEDCQLWKPFLLLGVFGLAGIVLVVFLSIFNLTVSEGTIGGLLFYANFVHANHESCFPVSAIDSNSNFFQIFIAWLNLDVGFEVCFYEGMDAYQKQWWEFGFTLYVLFLELMIIILSRKFVFFTRMLGRNAVNVLSTTMLLVYPRLLRSILKSLQYSTLQLSDDTQKYVWYFDGDIDYFQGKHIPLGIVASLLSIVVALYAMSLLFLQCLQRHSSWCFLRWVETLKPFFDSYTGPCRDNYRFWPGLLLFLRFALLSVYTILTPKPKLYFVMGFCIIIFILACVSPHGVYKKWPLNILEFSFFLNLALLSGLVVSLPNVSTPIVFTYPSVGIAMITFFGILIYHGYKRIITSRVGRKLLSRFQNRQQRQWVNIQEGYDETSDTPVPAIEREDNNPLSNEHWPRVVHFNELREPLLTND